MPFRSDAQIRSLMAQQVPRAHESACYFVSAILPLVGLTDVQARSSLYPYDTDAQALAMAKFQNTCGLATEIGWRGAGVDDPELYESYQKRVNKARYAVMLEREIAQKQGAWQDATTWIEGTELPDIADCPIIGCKSCGAAWARNVVNTEHEYTIVAHDPAGQGIHHSIDGGQPGIAFRTRALVEVWTSQGSDGRRRGELWASSVDDQGRAALAADGRPVTGRRFIGFTRTALLRRGVPQVACAYGRTELRSALPKVLAVSALMLTAYAAVSYARRLLRVGDVALDAVALDVA